MQPEIAQLKTLLAEVADLNAVEALLEWDMDVNMPPGGSDGRGHQRALLSRLAHERFTSDELGRLLSELEPHAAGLDPDSDEARLIRVTRREYRRQIRVPADYVDAFAKATTAARQAWLSARARSDFKLFCPTLERVVDLLRRYAEYFAPYDHVYDPLLDLYEPGMKTAEVKAIFEAIRPQQVALVQAIGQRPQVSDAFLHQPFDLQKQWDFGEQIITRFGYDWERGRQDRSAHPFTTSFGIGDVRITTRLLPDFFSSALLATLHESGHALYEQGFSPALSRTLLDQAASLAVHESQSRLWENLVGRSLPFWEHFYPQAQAIFPSQLGEVDLISFYRGVNKVEPSLIRVEADEATYNLHIMLRLELEIALMEGELAVKDLPGAWNERMQAYLGITPPDDARGVLQDIHWSSGQLGYFSTYALGNLISVQLWERLREDLPDLDDHLRRGEFVALLHWLGEKVHCHGAKYEPQELVERVTGSKIDPGPYLRYLEAKYAQIYHL